MQYANVTLSQPLWGLWGSGCVLHQSASTPRLWRGLSLTDNQVSNLLEKNNKNKFHDSRAACKKK